MLGGMQDWPLRVMRILDHAEREHGTREVVSLEAGGTTRSNWAGVARDARQLARALERLGVDTGARIGALARNHGRHSSLTASPGMPTVHQRKLSVQNSETFWSTIGPAHLEDA